MNVENRTIFEGDNLHILRGLDSETIDLIYLDPPFNSNRTYEAPIGSDAAGAAFKDAWTLSDLDNAWHGELAEYEPALYSAISAAEFSHSKSMKAYLIMMGIRMLEMRRVLKPTGSIYLHCDPTASHYLKTMMDAVFGNGNFLGDITWKRYAAHSLSKAAIDTVSDHLLYYAKDNEHVMANRVTSPLDTEALNKKFPHVETETGRRFQHVALEQNSNRSSAGELRKIGDKTVTSDIGWRWNQSTFDERIAKNPYLIYWTRTGKPRYKIYADEYAGEPVGNIWTDISYLASGNSERTGYPTQKPLALLGRIIEASSNRNGIVLDPFCGCATTCIAAEGLQRQWIGIDLSPKAVELVKMRLERDLDLTEDMGLLGDKVIHRTDIPTRLVPAEPRQIHAATLFSTEDSEAMALSQVELRQYKSYKHTLFGIQEGKCNGCEVLFPFRNMTIDHIIPRSRGGSDAPDNLQLLCAACNSTKGNRTQDELIQSLRDQGVIREDIQEY